MASINLQKMSLGELKAHRKAVDAAIATFEDRKRKEAKTALEAVAKKHGMTLDQILGGKKKARRKYKVRAKYRNPENASETWSGRGRQPRWFKAAIDGGADPENLAI